MAYAHHPRALLLVADRSIIAVLDGNADGHGRILLGPLLHDPGSTRLGQHASIHDVTIEWSTFCVRKPIWSNGRYVTQISMSADSPCLPYRRDIDRNS
jgi:hypothetical protein